MAVSPLALRKRILEHIDAGDRARQGRAGRRDLDEDEFAGRSARSSTRSTRPSQAGVQIDLVVRGICCLRPGVPACPRTSASSRSSAASSSTAASTASAPATACRTEGRGLHLVGRHDAAQSRPPRRGAVPILNPTVHEQVLDQIMVANFKDNEQSWKLLPDGSSTASRPAPGEEPFNAHKYFMTNPSLSGRGKSLKKSSPAALRAASSALKRQSRPRSRAGTARSRGAGCRHRHRLELGAPRRLRRADARADADLQRKGARRPRARGAVDRIARRRRGRKGARRAQALPRAMRQPAGRRVWVVATAACRDAKNGPGLHRRRPSASAGTRSR